MFSAAVFVEGKFQLTKRMLSDLRAAGYFEGYGRAGYGKRPKTGHDAFAEEVEKIRLASLAAWREWLAREARLAARELSSKGRAVLHSPGDCLRVVFYVTGHWRHDPDAWYLLGKPALDGMAKAFGWSDRFAVWDTAGRVAKVQDDYYYLPPCPRFTNSGRVGFWMGVAEVRP